MDFEVGAVCALFSVNLIPEVAQELLERVNRVSANDVGDHDRCFKDRRHATLVLHFFDTFANHLSDFRAHDLRNLAPILPKDVCDALLTQLTIDTHVQLEVLVNQHLQELALATREMGEVASRLVKHDVDKVGFKLLYPLKVVLSPLDLLLWVVFEPDRALIGSEVLAVAERACDAGFALLFPASRVALDRRPVRVALTDDFDPLLAA